MGSELPWEEESLEARHHRRVSFLCKMITEHEHGMFAFAIFLCGSLGMNVAQAFGLHWGLSVLMFGPFTFALGLNEWLAWRVYRRERLKAARVEPPGGER